MEDHLRLCAEEEAAEMQTSATRILPYLFALAPFEVQGSIPVESEFLLFDSWQMHGQQ
jgi:hypothetical protein